MHVLLHANYLQRLQRLASLLFLRLLLGFWRRQLKRVRRPVNTRANLLPGATSSLEVTECLGELQGLGDDALLLLVVPNLRVAGHREVFPQGVTFESVVGHDAAQVGMPNEEDAKQVVNLAFIPIGAVKQANDAGNRRGLVGVCLDPDSGVVADAEEVVDNLEALVASREVDGGDVADLGELGRSVVCSGLARLLTTMIEAPLTLEERKHGNDAGGANVDGQFILPDRELLDVLGQAAHEPRAVLVKIVGFGLVLVRGVHRRDLQGTDGIAGSLARVGSVLGQCDVLATGCGETPHSGFGPRLN
jgi:hypothetical protein